MKRSFQRENDPDNATRASLLRFPFSSFAGKISRPAKWAIVLALALTLLPVLRSLPFYFQAAAGHLKLIAAARPIDALLHDPNTPEELKHKLLKVTQIREFAVRELGLPDNGSYRDYVDIGRPAVAWNVFATTEFSLQPVEWCFPVAGCVNYRGYFNKDDAIAYAKILQDEGYDVHVSEVPAYSTLGWFGDPVLSSFIHYPEINLARLIFHELAHQAVYAKGDTQFNESFAVAVETEGVARWLSRHGSETMRKTYFAYQARKKDYLDLLMRYRSRLDALYASGESAASMRSGKARIFSELKNEFGMLKVGWGGYTGYDNWFNQRLTNAHLASIAAYHSLAPGFRALMAQQPDMPAFFAAARELAALPKPLREQRLIALEAGAATAAPLPVHRPQPARPVRPARQTVG
ncbi:aminopeptidase [Noviherbaspirillum aerium]|uniref:aminopeptidase n=1 Tax=Noviherbaspirillum aerium TaxID=2588497 RepID=UPI00124D5E8F|nr:aminopeptidase [Noviherbaspirillum aerium]